MGLGFPGLRRKNLLGRLAARGGVADGSPLSGGRSRSPCGDVSFYLSRRKSGGPRRATGVVPVVIAGERMERVIGERGASADRSGGHPAAPLGAVAHRSPHEWNSHRTDSELQRAPPEQAASSFRRIAAEAQTVPTPVALRGPPPFLRVNITCLPTARYARSSVGGVADGSPLSGGQSHGPCGDVSSYLSRRKSGGPRRATGVVPVVIAGERMEQVIGDRGASADRSGAIRPPRSARLHIDLRMSGIRIRLI